MAQVVTRPEGTHGLVVEDRFLYGYLAEFDDPDALLAAANRAREQGFKKMDAYSPFPLEGLDTALGFRDHFIPWIMFTGGVLGAIGGFSLLYWSQIIEYPLNIGGRPAALTAFGWPHFIPITFECTVLLAALSGIVGMFMLNGLPQPYHPLFDAPDFDRASSDRFFLCVEARDPRFDRERTWEWIQSLGARRVTEVELRK